MSPKYVVRSNTATHDVITRSSCPILELLQLVSVTIEMTHFHIVILSVNRQIVGLRWDAAHPKSFPQRRTDYMTRRECHGVRSYRQQLLSFIRVFSRQNHLPSFLH